MLSESKENQSEIIFVDNHFHARQYCDFNSNLVDILDTHQLCAISSCHDSYDFECVQRLAKLTSRPNSLLASFGIHPQWPVMDYKEYLYKLGQNKSIVALGECGFDFFSQSESEVLDVQKAAFEYQLELAREFNLPLVVHLRKATHMIFRYKTSLGKLPAVIFHSWPGPANEALSILKSGINAYFSFGTPILWGARKALETIQSVGLGRILTESDAPYQTVRGTSYTNPAQVRQLVSCIADKTNSTTEEVAKTIFASFCKIYLNES